MAMSLIIFTDLTDPHEYICQVFYRQNGINVWIAVFSFFPKDFLEVHELMQYNSVLTYFIYSGGERALSCSIRRSWSNS